MLQIDRSPRAIYEEHARNRRLAYQYSPDLDRAVFYPRIACPFGGTAPLEWRVSAGRGTLHALSMVHPAKGEAYSVALVDLDEGFRMMSTVRGATGDLSEIGRRVMLAFEEPAVDGGIPRAVFDWEGAA